MDKQPDLVREADDFLKSLMHSDATKEMAQFFRAYYKNMLAAGFNSKQAMDLLKEFQKNILIEALKGGNK